jgi:glyoxylase-like metal-dependent hydrolase (beta-lactamase superfamily II)
MKRSYLGLLILFCLPLVQQENVSTYHSPNFDLVELADGVFACVHKPGGKAICNVGIVDNGAETIIFDTFLSPEVAEEIPVIVEKMGMSPIKYVINSHSHNDHIRGNQVFGDDVHIISSTETRDLIEEWEPKDIEEERKIAPSRFAFFDSLYQNFKGDTSSREYINILMWRPYYEVLANSHKEVKTRLPDLLLDGNMTLKGPKRTVQLLNLGAGHTESDMVMYLPEDKVIFTADLIFNECHPYLPHGIIAEWKHYLLKLDSMDVGTVVPGHGSLGGKEIIGQMHNYITSLEALAEEMHENNLEAAAVDTISIPENYRHWMFDRFFRFNMKFLYAEAKQ